MNFFENCSLMHHGNGYSIDVMGHRLNLTAEQNAALSAAGIEDRRVTIGVRPVHMNLGHSGIAAEIDVSELMGSEMHLHLNAGGKDIVAVVPTANEDFNTFARHTVVNLTFDPRLVHIFDPESEKNLI